MNQLSWRDKHGVTHLVSTAISRWLITYCESRDQPVGTVTQMDRDMPTCLACIYEKQQLA